MPHCMKRFLLYIALCAVVAAMVACNTRAVSTPELYANSVLYRSTPEGVRDTIRAADSLRIGDTLRMFITMHGGYNTLTSFMVKTDTSALAIALEIDPIVVDSFLTTGTDLDKAQLVFVPEKVTLCSTFLRFIPRKSGKHQITMTVGNDAGESYSPRSFLYEPLVR